MRRIHNFGFLIACVGFNLFAAMGCSDPKPRHAVQWVEEVQKLLPRNWIVDGFQDQTGPYNLAVNQSQDLGCSVTCNGPTVVRGPRSINPERESFTVWFMPASYIPTKPKGPVGQFSEAVLIGENEEVKVYGKSFVSDVPTWPRWEKDLINHFKLKIKSGTTSQ